jgi:superfamily II DNA/RNA helicase
MRNRRLGQLRDGRIQFLVATDVAARGIDVSTISHVFNYGLPMKAEDYVHRIGRTGRAGRTGIAITIAEFRDRFRIKDIEFFTKQVLSTGFGGGGGGRFNDRASGRRFGDKPAGRFGGGAERGYDERSGDRFADRSGDRFSGAGDRPAGRFGDKPAGRFANDRGDERFSSNRSFGNDSFSGRFDGEKTRNGPSKFGGGGKPAGQGSWGKAGGDAGGRNAPSNRGFGGGAGVNWVGAKPKKADFRKRQGS